MQFDINISKCSALSMSEHYIFFYIYSITGQFKALPRVTIILISRPIQSPWWLKPLSPTKGRWWAFDNRCKWISRGRGNPWNLLTRPTWYTWCVLICYLWDEYVGGWEGLTQVCRWVGGASHKYVECGGSVWWIF